MERASATLYAVESENTPHLFGRSLPPPQVRGAAPMTSSFESGGRGTATPGDDCDELVGAESIEVTGTVRLVIYRSLKGYQLVSKRKRPRQGWLGGIRYSSVYVLRRRLR